MMKCAIYNVFLTVLMVLMPLVSSPAEAALGDFLNKWGGEYNLQDPTRIAVDSGGNTYVISTGGVYVFNNTGIFLRHWSIASPGGVAVDSSGNVYVASKNGVYVYSDSGTLLRQIGTYGFGDGQFNYPRGIAVDSSGNVYVADSGNQRVQVFGSTGTFLRKWGSSGPSGIAVDSSGNVYVAESSNSRVQVFSGTGIFLRQWGVSYLSDIAVDSNGDVYVVSSSNHRLQVFSGTGTLLREWGGNGPGWRGYGSGNGQFYFPQGIAVDGSGNVYVADTWNNRVQIFNNSGAFLRKYDAYESGGGFYAPYGIDLDGGGNVYVADTFNHRVQVFTSTGTFLKVWGRYGSGDGQFKYPFGIAVDSKGDVYVADLLNSRVQVFNSSGTYLRQWSVVAPYGIAVDSSDNVYVGEQGTYIRRVQVFSSTGTFLREIGSYGYGDGQFLAPYGIAFDSSGNVYVVDSGNENVQVFSSAGVFLRKWGGHFWFFAPWGIALDANDNVYVSDRNNRVQVFGNTGALLGRWGSSGSGDGQFNIPSRLAINSSGKVYVADSYNHRIQVFEGYNSCALTANAGPDQTLEQTSPAGASVTLSGYVAAQGCADALTYEWSWLGGSATVASTTVYMSPGTTHATLTVKSGARTASDTVAITVRDTQAPVTAALITGTTGNNGWYLSDTSLYLSASDSGSGVKEIHYGIDGAETIIADGIASFTIGAEGPHSVAYYSKDNAGNPEGVHLLTVNIDKTPPTISASVSQASNPNGWNNTDVTVTSTCSDTLSGIAACPAQIPVSTEGAGQIVSGTAFDKAGNSATVSVTLNIDKTLPAISITGVANGATYILGSVPTTGYTVTDASSGVATQSADLAGGIANGAGTYTYTVIATDKAGNVANAVAVYSVVYGFGGFLPPVSLGKPFKLGSTIPVKFQLTDASGAYISTANATIMVQKFSGDQPVDEPIEVTSTSSADAGNTFRYSAADNLYIYNLSTDGLSEGTWQIQAKLDDGTVKTAFMLLKAK